MTIKRFTFFIALTTACVTWAADPSVTINSVTQADDRLVTVTYTLSDGPAIVTLDVETNATGDVWASIGGGALLAVSGDVCKRVENGTHAMTWSPTGAASDFIVTAANTRLAVKAWPLDDTPDILVVDLNASTNSPLRYYPFIEALPGGLLANSAYRTSHLVMRRIHAKDVVWSMGGSVSVTLDHDYYIGVFEFTQMQAYTLATNRLANFCLEGMMRPQDALSYNRIRESGSNTREGTTYSYPNAPHPASWLGLLRARTGLAFDLPPEADWEFACRAGTATTTWNDGSSLSSDPPGRFAGNNNSGGTTSPTDYENWAASAGMDDGKTGIKVGATALCGSYAPNAWGLYDMHGNMYEWCLDWYGTSIAANGAVNVSDSDPNKLADGTTDGSTRVRRGGGFTTASSSGCYSGARSSLAPHLNYVNLGFRAWLPVAAQYLPAE